MGTLNDPIEDKAKDLDHAQQDLRRALVSLARAKKDEEEARRVLNRCGEGLKSAHGAVEECRKLVAKAERAITGEPEPKSETRCGPRAT